ncbi:MAG: spermidine/putrescine ABC transporter substrate-binding protein [Anaerolineales bacterium]|nr:spermidine/putrescine ABC transporter substrate-binding protein [Anaerolineales bacterium]
MSKNNLFKLQALSVIASIALIACGSDAKETATAIATAASVKVTSAGFECPVPEFPMAVTSKELNLFVWTECIPPDMQECFELVYGVKVNRDEYSSMEKMYARLSAGGSSYDLVQPTDYFISLMVRQDILQELEHNKLPVLKNFDSNYLDFSFDPGNKYTIPYVVGTDAIVVNTDAVQNVPQSWDDLWKPEYADRMVFLDDSRTVIGLSLLTLGYDVNTTDPTQLDEAGEKLAQLIPNIKLFDSDSPKTALLAGDVDLGMTWNGEAFLVQQKKPAIQYIYPTEGAILWQNDWAMPKDAPHTDAAYAWLNYINQGDIFWMMLRDFPYTNPNKAALDYARDNQKDIYNAYMSSPITNTPVEVIKNGHRIDDVGEALSLYDQIWTEVKGP